MGVEWGRGRKINRREKKKEGEIWRGREGRENLKERDILSNKCTGYRFVLYGIVCDSVQSHKDSLCSKSICFFFFLWSPQPEACLVHDLWTHTSCLAK